MSCAGSRPRTSPVEFLTSSEDGLLSASGDACAPALDRAVLSELAALDAVVKADGVAEAAGLFGVPEAQLEAETASLARLLGVVLTDPRGRPTDDARRLAAAAQDVLSGADLLFRLADELAGVRTSPEPALLWRPEAPRPAALADTAGRYLRVNDEFARLLGRDRACMTGLDFREVTHEADIASDLAEDEALFDGSATAYSKVKRYVTAAGAVRAATVTCSRVRDGQDVAYLLVATPPPAAAVP